MRVPQPVLLMIAVAAILSCQLPLLAREDAPPVLAVQPEVQTAAWAQSWWMPRHQEKLAAIKDQQVDLLMIGDSITHGWENAGRQVWDQYYANRNAFNLGFSGDRTENVLWRLQHGAVDGIAPKLAVIMIGTNNTGHRQDKPEHTAAGVRAILDELQTRLPEMKILVLAIFPRGADANDNLRKINAATNEILAGFADDKRVFYLDINDRFLKDDGTLPKSIMPDLLHPNAEGYGMWAAAMEPTVERLLGEEK
jgi:beta-glucosidase